MKFAHYPATLVYLLTASLLFAAGQPYPEIITYEYSQGQGPRHKIKELIRTTPLDKLAEVEANILATLDAQNGTEAGKRFCFQLLRNLAGPATAKTIVPYLADETYSDSARYAIEGMVSDDASRVLRDALGKTTGRLRMGMIMSLGERRDAASTQAIAAFLNDADRHTVAAALQALGNIGNQDAVHALTKAELSGALLAQRDNAMLICAEHMVAAGDTPSAVNIGHRLADSSNKNTRIGVMSVLLNAGSKDAIDVVASFLKDADPSVVKTAIKQLGASGNKNATALISAAFDSFSADAQIAALAAFDMLGDSAALGVVKNAMASDNPDIARIALTTLGAVGTGKELDTFLTLFKKNEGLGRDIKAAISRLKGADIIAQIVAKAASADDVAAALLIDSLEARGDSSAVPGILKLLPTGTPRAERAAGNALARLGRAKDVETILALMMTQPEIIDTLEKPLVFIVKREGVDCSPTIAANLVKSSGKAKAAMIRICGQAGGSKTVETLTPLLASSDADLVDAAVRGLTAYKHESTIAPMVDALGYVASDTHKILLSRAVLAQLPAAGMSVNAKVAALGDLIRDLPTEQEKKTVLAQLNKYACPAAVALAASLKNDPALAADATRLETEIQLFISKPGLSASHGQTKTHLAFDGNAGTRWDTAGVQKPGQWFTLEMRESTSVNRITLDTRGSGADYPRQYDVQISDNNQDWSTVVEGGKGDGPVTEIAFSPAIRARFIKIIQTGSSPRNYWSIHELSFE